MRRHSGTNAHQTLRSLPYCFARRPASLWVSGSDIGRCSRTSDFALTADASLHRNELALCARSGSFPLHSIILMAGQQINTTRVAGLRIAYFAAAGSMRAVFQC
jgi:hypothetical protein